MKQKLILGFAVIVVGVLALIILLGRPKTDAPELASARLTSEEILMSDPDKAGGLMYLYDYKAETPVTPAPRGYKPFYVTHYGRHGARYAMASQYDMLRTVLTKAKDAGCLTERGMKLYEDYLTFYEDVIFHDGELSGLGIEQERTIATRFATRFPEIFEGDTHASAISTSSHRVILSMAAFIDALQAFDSSFTVDESYSDSYSPILGPNWSVLAKDRPDNIDKLIEPYIPYFRETVDVDGILGRLFVNPREAVKQFGLDDVYFLRIFFDIISDVRCIPDAVSIFDGIFTLEDLVPFTRAAWYRVYLFLARYKDSPSLCPDFAAYTLKDMVDKADEDIASGQVQLRLRFGHDSSILPLLVVLNVDGLGETSSTPEEAYNTFPLWELPMGASLQMVFYRSRHNKDILVKLLRNENEASLPITPVQGPYYRWDDVREYCNNIISASLAKVQ